MTTDDEDDEAIEREERAIYLVMALAGLPVLIALCIEGGTIGAGETISLACVVLAMIGLSYRLRRTRRLPKATLQARGIDSRRPPR
jgi:hypothetical protein